MLVACGFHGSGLKIAIVSLTTTRELYRDSFPRSDSTWLSLQARRPTGSGRNAEVGTHHAACLCNTARNWEPLSETCFSLSGPWVPGS
jgi:hypothetical protein